jgi:hypothetical protein
VLTTDAEWPDNVSVDMTTDRPLITARLLARVDETMAIPQLRTLQVATQSRPEWSLRSHGRPPAIAGLGAPASFRAAARHIGRRRAGVPLRLDHRWART